MRKTLLLSLLLVAAFTLAACAVPAQPTSAPAPAAIATSAPAEPTAVPEAMTKDLVDTAVAAGSFTTLATALKAAGLVDVLKGEDNFTVFAPTDEAFAALPAGALEALLQDPEALKAVLLYHVVPGKVMAADVVKLTSAKTVNGQSVKIAVNDGKVMVDGANVVKTDIAASNGVIHVIDAVLLPK